MSISTSRAALADFEAVDLPGHAVGAFDGLTVSRRRSVVPSRRAVMYLLPGNLPVPGDLAAWCTERAFNFYLARVRAPGRPAVVVGRTLRSRQLTSLCAGLDVACAQVRETDEVQNVIVMAQGACAIAAARWADSRRRAIGHPRAADALILCAPVLQTRQSVDLDIGCPVLVLAEADAGPARSGIGQWLPRRRAADMCAVRLGRHVTWLRLREGADEGRTDGSQFFTELGRWLGAYMYGQMRDQLL